MNKELSQLLSEHSPEIAPEIQGRIQTFYELLRAENEIQNLTRLISPEDFYFGHLLDVLELLKTGWIKYPALDIGSGGGIPGLLAAIIHPGLWILCESEKRKADFLQRAVNSLRLETTVQVTSLRVEDYLKSKRVNTLVARAVGNVERIHGWIRKYSTWNTIKVNGANAPATQLILFKGPGWEEEWKTFGQGKYRDEVLVKESHSYKILRSLNQPAEEKSRLLIQLVRK